MMTRCTIWAALFAPRWTRARWGCHPPPWPQPAWTGSATWPCLPASNRPWPCTPFDAPTTTVQLVGSSRRCHMRFGLGYPMAPQGKAVGCGRIRLPSRQKELHRPRWSSITGMSARRGHQIGYPGGKRAGYAPSLIPTKPGDTCRTRCTQVEQCRHSEGSIAEGRVVHRLSTELPTALVDNSLTLRLFVIARYCLDWSIARRRLRHCHVRVC